MSLNGWILQIQSTNGQQNNLKKTTEWSDENFDGIRGKKKGESSSSKYNPKKGGHSGKRKKKYTEKPNDELMDKKCLIYGVSYSYEDCKVLSDFGNKWCATRQPKYIKLINTNTVQEDNYISSEAV